MNLHPAISATLPPVAFLDLARTTIATCSAGIVLFVIGVWAAKDHVAEAHGLDKVVALANLCLAMPLAVFAAEHFSAANGISQIVPKYMGWPLFWTYLVGCALLSASLSIATSVLVQWSGILFGIMMFTFDAMMAVPATIADPHNRIDWALVFREPSFGSGAWMLAILAMSARHARARRILFLIGRTVIGAGAILYGFEHFLHPLNVPGVPLEKFMPTWIPFRVEISYVTGAILLAAGICILLGKKTRMAATYLGSWILLLVVVIYGPILVTSLLNASTDAQVEGVNYFFDTLLYAGAILALAKAFRSEPCGAV
jgi:uncharacterized membrane protein